MKSTLLSSCLSLGAFAFSAFGGPEQSIEALIPKMASDTVEERYAAQMELQSLAANASRPGADMERVDFSKALATKATDSSVPQPARVWLVRQLEYVGSGEAIPALAALLNDGNPELKECARRALEKNSAPAATEKLRTALQQATDPNWKLGLINALGQRGDVLAVSLIGSELDRPETGSCAASALAKIANEPAVQNLWSAYERKNPWAGDALIKAANRLATKGEGKRSVGIFTKLFAGTMPPRLRAAALSGLAKADPAGTKKLIAQALSDSDWRMQNAAVTAATDVYGTATTAALVPYLSKVSPDAKVLIIRVLDASAQTQIIATASNPQEPENLRMAAVERLGGIGTAASVPALFNAAETDSPVVQKVARISLARVSAGGVDQAIENQAAQGSSRLRATAIGVLAERNATSCLPRLMDYAADSDPTVSAAACAALGKLATEKELPSLARLAMSGKISGADSALQSVAARAPHKAAAAHDLIALAEGSESNQPALFYDTLAILGGEEPMVVVVKATRSDKEEVRDAAIRALSNWPDFPACTRLLELAKDADAKKVHRVLAVQGIARLVKSSDKEPVNARLDAASAAMALAQRDEDKKLLLSAIAAVPDAKAADAIKPFLKEAQFQPDAGLAGVTLAQSLLPTDRAAARSLAQAIIDSNPAPDVLRKAEGVLKRTGGS